MVLRSFLSKFSDKYLSPIKTIFLLTPVGFPLQIPNINAKMMKFPSLQ